MTTNQYKNNYLHYNLYLDAPIDYSKIDQIRILKINENQPLSEKVLRYIEELQFKYLEFGFEFDNPIDNLPICVEHIFFHPYSKFNYPLVNLPVNLKTLIIGNGYWKTMENLPCSLLFLGYHKSHNHFINYYGAIIMNLNEIINTNLPKLLYISIPYALNNNINFSSSTYTKKILKNSSESEVCFINLIKDKHNIDYFMVYS